MKLYRLSVFLFNALLVLTATAGGSHTGGDGHEETAIGEAGEASKVTRTVAVNMTDAMQFKPAKVSVKQGETIRFVVNNQGQLKHEFVLGKVESLKEHAALMLKFPKMEHADPNMVSLPPSHSGEVIWKFTRAGPVDFACLQPGHFEAGMKGEVQVAKSKATVAKPVNSAVTAHTH